MPLAFHAGWPKSVRSPLTRCISGESGGDPTASNGICRGLMQIHVCHAVKFLQVTGRRYFNGVYDALANLRFGCWLWRQGGWGVWQVMQ
jgi:hypothetical protein